jgi:hypothetical protein
MSIRLRSAGGIRRWCRWGRSRYVRIVGVGVLIASIGAGCGDSQRISTDSEIPMLARHRSDWQCTELPPPAEARTYIFAITPLNHGEVAAIVSVTPLRSQNIRFRRTFITSNMGVSETAPFDPNASLLLPAKMPASQNMQLEAEFEVIDPTRPAGVFGARVVYESIRKHVQRSADVWASGVFIRTPEIEAAHPKDSILCDIATTPPLAAPLDLMPAQPPPRISPTPT